MKRLPFYTIFLALLTGKAASLWAIYHGWMWGFAGVVLFGAAIVCVVGDMLVNAPCGAAGKSDDQPE